MADEWITFEIDEDEVIAGFYLQEQLGKQRLKRFLDDLADKGRDVLEMYAPYYKGDDPQREGGYTHRHIDRSGVMTTPDGLEHEVIVGIKAGESDHPFYANRGTGMYGRYDTRVVSPKGGLMWFYSEKYGHVISVYSTRGQRPQRFIYETWRDLAIYAEFRLMASNL